MWYGTTKILTLTHSVTCKHTHKHTHSRLLFSLLEPEAGRKGLYPRNCLLVPRGKRHAWQHCQSQSSHPNSPHPFCAPPPTVVDCPVSCHVYSPLCCSCCILLLPLQSDFTDEQHKSLDEVCSIFTGVCLPAQSGVRPGSAAHSRPLICSLLHR